MSNTAPQLKTQQFGILAEIALGRIEVAEAVIGGRFDGNEAKRVTRALNALVDIALGRYHGKTRALDSIRARLLGEEDLR
jgi:hypothetical protein